MECDERLLETILELARLRVEREEACKAIEDMRRLLEPLRSAREGHPLYYVWEQEQYKPPERPIRHDRVTPRDLGVAVDEEGRAVFPWKGPRG